MPRRTIIGISILLGACGGGGGGDNRPTPAPEPNPPVILAKPAAPVVVFSGSQEPANLSIDDVPAWAATVTGTVSYMRNFEFRPEPFASGPSPLLVEEASPDGSARTLQLDITDGTGWFSIEYENFREGDLLLDGIVLRNVTEGERSPYDVDLEFTNLRVDDGVHDRILHGTYRSSTDPADPNAYEIEANLLVTEAATGATRWLNEFLISVTRPTSFAAGEVYSGRIYETHAGFVDLSSEGAHEIVSSDSYPERGGVFRVSGADASFGIVPINNLLASVLYDADADGRYETFRRSTWLELEAGESGDSGTPPVGSSTRPVPNAGADRDIQVGQEVQLNGILSRSVDGSYLTPIWKLAVSPVDSQASLSDSPTLRPILVPDIEGDYLLTLAVSGEGGSAYDSILVTARSTEVVDRGIRMRLDRPTEVALGETVTLNASASLPDRGVSVPALPMIYAWELTRPAGSQATLTETDTPTNSFVLDAPGFYSITVGHYYHLGYENTQAMGFGTAVQYHARAVIRTTADTFGLPIAADLDKDGETDIATLQLSTDGQNVELGIYLASDAGRFSRGPVYPFSNIQNVPATGDLNGDGFADVAIAAFDRVNLLYASGALPAALNTRFIVRDAACTSAGNLVPDIVDADGDGDEDLVLIDRCMDQVTTWLQDEFGELGVADVRALVLPNALDAAIGDLNGDGRADIVAPQRGNDSASLYLRDGGGAYVLSATITDVPSSRAIIADITGDGLNEIVLTDSDEFAVIEVDASGSPGTPVRYPVEITGEPLGMVGDLNGDGLPDLTLSRTSSTLLAIQVSPAEFVTTSLDDSPLTSSYFAGATIADIDGDGRADVIRPALHGIGVWLQQPE